MLHPSAEYSESRPFKIFISLLDKWEIGSPLTEALVYDAFQAIMHLITRFQDGREDVSLIMRHRAHLTCETALNDCQHFVRSRGAKDTLEVSFSGHGI